MGPMRSVAVCANIMEKRVTGATVRLSFLRMNAGVIGLTYGSGPPAFILHAITSRILLPKRRCTPRSRIKRGPTKNPANSPVHELTALELCKVEGRSNLPSDGTFPTHHRQTI